MGHSASVYANKITICLTTPQRDFVVAGMRRHGIGLSEYMRRLLDQIIERQDQSFWNKSD